jgi:voltage-gated potassium channel
MMLLPPRTIYYALAGVVVIIIVGATGYHFVEGWSWFDGLYMTMITLSTIGYGETHPLSPHGRYFTLGLIVIGVIGFGFLISNLTQTLIETEISAALGRRRLYKDINKLRNHYILCGAGRVGNQIVDEFRRKGVEFVIIERQEQVAERLLAHGDLVLIGDATDEAVLEGAHVREARGLLASAATDAENVYIVLTARGMNPDIYIVARATEASAESKLIRAGANRVVSPVLIGSHRMAQAALSPAIADFIELTTMTEKLDLNFEQIRIVVGSPLDGCRVADADFRLERGMMLVAVTDQQGRMVFNPPGEQVLRAGDLLIAIGNHAALEKLARASNYKRGDTMKLPNLPNLSSLQ